MTKFKNLMPGQFFAYERVSYIKTQEVQVKTPYGTSVSNAVIISAYNTGAHVQLDEDDLVCPFVGKLMFVQEPD
jgi:hypothetical protein